jgi:hypothetical protein
VVWRTFIGAQLSTENSIFEPSIELFDSEDRNFPFAAGIVSYQITFVSILVNRDSAAPLQGSNDKRRTWTMKAKTAKPAAKKAKAPAKKAAAKKKK